MSRAFKNGTIQTIVIVALVAVAVSGLYLAERAGYVAVVPSGSMCIQYDASCDGWTHPFDRTLHVGDILIIEPINPNDLNTNYPNSDIIVFHNPQNPSELIVHRIIGVTDVNGILYFTTKGDGNGNPWPQTPQ
jgi:signal peptidase I